MEGLKLGSGKATLNGDLWVYPADQAAADPAAPSERPCLHDTIDQPR